MKRVKIPVNSCISKVDGTSYFICFLLQHGTDTTNIFFLRSFTLHQNTLIPLHFISFLNLLHSFLSLLSLPSPPSFPYCLTFFPLPSKPPFMPLFFSLSFPASPPLSYCCTFFSSPSNSKPPLLPHFILSLPTSPSIPSRLTHHHTQRGSAFGSRQGRGENPENTHQQARGR